MTWQTTNRRKWQSCIVRTFILKHVPNKLENSDPPKSIFREVPRLKETLPKKSSTSPCCDFEKNRGFVASKNSSRQKPIRTTRSSMSCASALWELCLRCLLSPRLSKKCATQSQNFVLEDMSSLVGNKNVGTWKLVKREDDVFRRCYLSKGFCMLVSWDGKWRRFHRKKSVGYTLGAKRNMFEVFKSCFTCLWSLKSINGHIFEKRS